MAADDSAGTVRDDAADAPLKEAEVTRVVKERDLRDARSELGVRTLVDVLNRRGYRVTRIAGMDDAAVEAMNVAHYDLLRARPAPFPALEQDPPAPVLAAAELAAFVVPRGKTAPVLPVIEAVLETQSAVRERAAAAEARLRALVSASKSARSDDREPAEPKRSGREPRAITAHHAETWLRELDSGAFEHDWPALRTPGSVVGQSAWAVLVRGKKEQGYNKDKAVKVNRACAASGVGRVLVLTEQPLHNNSALLLHRRWNGVCGESHVLMNTQASVLRHMYNDYGRAYRVLDPDAADVRAAVREAGGVEKLPVTLTSDASVGLHLGCRDGMLISVRIGGREEISAVKHAWTGSFLDLEEDDLVDIED